MRKYAGVPRFVGSSPVDWSRPGPLERSAALPRVIYCKATLRKARSLRSMAHPLILRWISDKSMNAEALWWFRRVIGLTTEDMSALN